MGQERLTLTENRPAKLRQKISKDINEKRNTYSLLNLLNFFPHTPQVNLAVDVLRVALRMTASFKQSSN